MPVLMLALLVSITGSVIGGKGNEKVGLIFSSVFFFYSKYAGCLL